MTKATTQDYLVVAVILLLGFSVLNFSADWIFRSQQIEMNEGFLKINENFILMHNNTNTITGALSVVVIDLNEKMEKVLDELFDRIWEDLEQT